MSVFKNELKYNNQTYEVELRQGDKTIFASEVMKILGISEIEMRYLLCRKELTTLSKSTTSNRIPVLDYSGGNIYENCFSLREVTAKKDSKLPKVINYQEVTTMLRKPDQVKDILTAAINKGMCKPVNKTGNYVRPLRNPPYEDYFYIRSEIEEINKYYFGKDNEAFKLIHREFARCNLI